MAILEVLSNRCSSSFHIAGELFHRPWEAKNFVPFLLFIRPHETSWITTWLFDSEEYQVGVGKVVTILHSLCKPAVSSPSEEAAVSIKEERPEIENEADEFKHKSLVPVNHVQRNSTYVQYPDKDIGAWFAESEEYQIPEIVKYEID